MSLKKININAENIEKANFSIKKLNSKKTGYIFTILYNNFFSDYIDFLNEIKVKKYFADLRTNSLLKTYQNNVNRNSWLNLNQIQCYKNEEMKAKVSLCLASNISKNFNILNNKTTNGDFKIIKRESLVLKTRNYPLNKKQQIVEKAIKLKKVNLVKNYLIKVEETFNKNLVDLKQLLDKKEQMASKYNSNLFDYYKWLIAYSYWLVLVDTFTDSLNAQYKSNSVDDLFENYLSIESNIKEPIILIRNIINLIKVLLHTTRNVYKQKNTIVNIKKELDYKLSSFQNLLDCFKKLDEYNLIDFSKINNQIYAKVKLEEKNDFIFNFINLYKNSLIGLNETDYIEFSWEPQLSSGENALFTLFARINNIFQQIKRLENNRITRILLLLDEAEIGFHPAWQKQYLYSLIKYINIINTEKLKVHLIFTTNNPIPLSDIQPSDVIYLENHKIKEMKNNKAFGTDLLTLYSDSFFINDGLIGKFADSKIKELINKCSKEKKFSKEELSYYKKLANIVGDNFIKQYLLEIIQNKEKTND